jgi:hypothetical protein
MIAATKPTVELIRRTDVRTDLTQSRAKIDQETIHEYADLYRDDIPMPAIVVFWDGEFYWLADGFHRYFAQQTLGLEDVQADVREGTQRDALQYSLSANLAHGLKRTNEDKRRSVEIAFSDDEWSTWSDGAIAELCGVSTMLVATVRTTFQVKDSLTSSKKPAKTRVGKDGKKYPAPKSSANGKPKVTEETPAGEAVEEFTTPTVEERRAEWNDKVDAFARKITALAKEAPRGGWWDEGHANVVVQQLRAVAGTVRQVKCDNICPLCEGECCDRCKGEGFMPKRSYEMAGGK